MENFSEVTQLISTENITYFERSQSNLEIIQAMLEKTQYDSGFFIVDLSTVIGQYKQWVDLLPRVQPYYAVKSNPNPTIIKTLAIMGAGFDCASKNEIKQVLEIVNNDSSRIIFANPAKSDSHLRYARNMDVDLMTFDNEFELLKIAHIHPGAQLVLRIKVDDSFSMCRFNSKFGADMDDVERLMKFAKMLELAVVGVSFHVGSGCRDVMAFDIAIERARWVFDIGRDNGFNLKILDIGGGFPGTENAASGVGFSAFAEQINNSLYRHFPADIFPEDYGLRVIAEPGRYFCSASHTLILNVIAKKKRVNRETAEVAFSYTLNDGIYGSMNCIMFDHAKPKIKPFNEREGKTYRCVVYGPTCDSVDVLSDDCELPDLAIGECVYIEDCGAYTTAAASQFNGFHLTPCEYIMRN